MTTRLMTLRQEFPGKIRNSKRTVGTRESSFNKMEAVPELFFVRIIASSFIVNENNSIGK